MAKMTLREYANAWLKNKGTTVTKAKKNAGKYKSIAAAKKAGSLYYTDKNGKVQLAVYAGDLTGPKPGGDKRTTSPKPKLRPGSTKDKPKVDSTRVAAEKKKAETGDKDAVAKGGKTVSQIKKTASDAISRSDSAKITYDQNKRISQQKRGDSPGQKFNAWYEKNGDKYKTMKSAMAAYKKTLK